MNRQLDSIVRLIDALPGAGTVEDFCSLLVESVTEYGFARARFYRYAEDGGSLRAVAQRGLDDDQAQMFHGLTLPVRCDSPIVQHTPKPSVVHPTDSPATPLTKELIRWIDVPLVHGGQWLGKLSCDMNSAEAEFTRDDLSFLEVVATVIAQHLVERPQRPLTPAESIIRSKQSYVLVLGKDSESELEVLRTIQHLVDSIGYVSHLVKDAPEIPEMTNEDKVRALADASRFVLVEDSVAAGQIVELKIMATNRVPTAILRRHGCGSTWMVADYHLDFAFMQVFEYTDDSLPDAITAACAWADGFVEQRCKQLQNLYTWRGRGECVDEGTRSSTERKPVLTGATRKQSNAPNDDW